MTNQPLDTAALRAIIDRYNADPDHNWEEYIRAIKPNNVLALLDENERKLNEQAKGYEISLQDQTRKHADLYSKHAALCAAILTGRWDEAARLAREMGE